MKLVFFVMLCPFFLFGKEKDLYKYGNVTPEEVGQKFFPADSQAGAVIMYNIGSIESDDKSPVIFTRREKIKIYDKNSLSVANQTMILFNDKNSSREISLSDIKGKTYNLENGK